ncbi:PIG-L family deacetylase [Aurantibacillus circumpalustris]|uniref:PIG-L family deacetylase n=1 Tax=Aurantibacillus circumpalustris TaxID=3036359 RepID=UPI00295A904A|nr:PIG-L family deacetylase [Aurantibacillus circumpalustris]
MKKLFLLLLVTSFSHFTLKSQTSQELNSSEILQGLKKLNTVSSILYIAAHPDDENTRLLGYLANEKNLRTGYLSLTRGDGGQNLIGKEQGELLGLIRTQELLAARRVDGAEQFFTRAKDFGYSKTPEETFEFWNKDSILSDVVLTIRKFKPDVIICRFPTTGEGGHGHHTASAILALEAFDAAADPTKFPEQLKYTQTWKTRRIFWNTFNFGSTNTTAPDQLKVDVGVYNPLFGKSYGEIASESRSMHKSQGFGSAKQRGSNIEYFKLLKGEEAKSDLMEGVNPRWDRMRGTESLLKTIEDCIKNFNPQQPEKSITALVQIHKELQNLDSKNDYVNYWKRLKLKETENLLFACSGLWLESFASDYIGIPGQEINLTTQIVNRNNSDLKINSISYFGLGDTSLNLSAKQNELYSFKRKLKLNSNMPYSSPYWLNEKHQPGLYTVKNKVLIGKPENEAAAKVLFDLTIQDLNIKTERNVVYKYTDPVKGEIYRPFEILPPITIQLSENVFVFTDNNPKTIAVTIKANAVNVSGTLMLKVSNGWEVTLKNPEISLSSKGDEVVLEAVISPSKNAKDGKIEAFFNVQNEAYSKSIKRIEYDHIPYQFILSDAEAGLINIDLKKTGTNIAYIPGAGDDVAACLKQIGYTVTLLTDELLTSEDLSKFTSIVTGVRAYNTNERLQTFHSKLMDYVNNGGNLIVQYNTNSRVGPLQAKIGPYPFTISRTRVTDEKADIKFVNEKHNALNFPNKITQKDFDGWIQERGIYFAEDQDKNYETIFSMNDPKEKSSEGSLIIGKYGAGNFVYTGLVFFRELPAGVPGAYRLLVNLLSLPQNK